MTARTSTFLLGATIFLALPAGQARAHWCDDLWLSSYNIAVRPDSDTSPKEVYVQNNMGYQLINFQLIATSPSGDVTLIPPTLTVPGTLLPGEKGTWKISAGSPSRIEDITFGVSFGDSPSQSACYPSGGAKAAMIVKNDGTLSPAPPPPGLSNPSDPGCSWDMGTQGRSLQYSAISDWDDLDGGLDKLFTLYCAGRASWGSTDGVSRTYCKDNASTSCPTSTPADGTGSKYDYTHLWAAGELAIRKSAMGARLGVFRNRLKCGVNDKDVGFAGYALFVLGYLGDDAAIRTYLEGQVGAGGNLGAIATAALYLMGDTTRKSAVQAGTQSSSVFVKVASAAALGIVDHDDAAVTSTIIPEVRWEEPDGGDDGQGMFSAHILELVAFSRRGWVPRGMGAGAVSFYAGLAGGGGSPGSGGTPGTGGIVETGGTPGSGGIVASGGAPGTGGNVGSGGTPVVDAPVASGGATGPGGRSGSGGTGAKLDGSVAADRPLLGGSTAVGGATGTAGSLASGGSTAMGGTPSSGGTSGLGLDGSIGAGGIAGRPSDAPIGTGGIGQGDAGPGGTTYGGGGQAIGGAIGSTGGQPGNDDAIGPAAPDAESPDGLTGPSTDKGGCSCNLGDSAHPSLLHLLACAAFAFALVRRRRR